MNPVIFGLVLLALLVGIVGVFDLGDAHQSQQNYCEMVSLWESNLHLPPEQRPG